MRPTRRAARSGISLAIVVGTLGAAGCAPGATPPAGPDPTAPQPTASAPVPAPTIAPEDVTCENMLEDATVDSFQATGWTVREDPFVILDLELPTGTACTWGDFSSPTNDDLVLFGWAPITTVDAAEIQAALVSEGWLREETGTGVIVTEDPAFALRLDDEGYGMTYLFGDGWVEVSDTRQGLDLIDLG